MQYTQGIHGRAHRAGRAVGSADRGLLHELKRRLGLGSYNPFGNVSQLQSLAHTLVARGVIGAAI